MPNAPTEQLVQTRSDFCRYLIAYFRSGWIFFIPYIAAYLIYAGLHWPVNTTGAGSWIPALLHFYWFLHAVNLLLAATALVSWWRGTSIHRPTSDFPYNLIPWFCLALLFWIPGIYLEWPSDPWEHLRRINEWHVHNAVMGHSAWKKSSYLLPYSLTGHLTGHNQLQWLNFYYTAICLLLCWQYYRLARAVGLGPKAGFVFVILQVVLLGNGVFSFYRYYGLSSGILAQMGVVALTQTAVVAVQHRSSASNWLRAILAGTILALFIVFNHPQGVGLAVLATLAVIFWKLFSWKPSLGWTLVCILAALSILPVKWYFAGDLFESFPEAKNWLSPWYGFKVMLPGSPGSGRLLQVLGWAGLANALIAVFLIRHNHVAGWLTLTPLLALCLPYIAFPFAATLFQQSTILTFHRMYLAIPSGLGLVCLADWLWKRSSPASALVVSGRFIFPGMLATVIFLVTASPGQPSFNRFWNAINSVPKDLSMNGLVTAYSAQATNLLARPDVRSASTLAGSSVLSSLFPTYPAMRYRPIGQPVADWLQQVSGVPSTAQALWDQNTPNLIGDSLMKDPSAWRTFSESVPHFVADVGDFGGLSTALQSAAGESPEVLTRALILINPARRYRLEMSLKQESKGEGHVLLAVAWYDDQGHLLESGKPDPIGAGHPAGWSNGTYSYFGPIGVNAPRQWTTYRMSFGVGALAAIPRNARAVRVGALLNLPPKPDTMLRLSNVRMWEQADSEQIIDGAFTGTEDWLLVVPKSGSLYTAASQAAQLSQHWPPQQTAFDYAGEHELKTTALGRRAVIVDEEAALFYLFPRVSGKNP